MRQQGCPGDVRTVILNAVRETPANAGVRAQQAKRSLQVLNTSREVFAAQMLKDSDLAGDLVRRRVVRME